MYRMFAAVMKPTMEAAAIHRADIPQPTTPAPMATSHATGIARVAGQYRPTIRNAMVASGSNAMVASTALTIGHLPCLTRPPLFGVEPHRAGV